MPSDTLPDGLGAVQCLAKWSERTEVQHAVCVSRQPRQHNGDEHPAHTCRCDPWSRSCSPACGALCGKPCSRLCGSFSCSFWMRVCPDQHNGPNSELFGTNVRHKPSLLQVRAVPTVAPTTNQSPSKFSGFSSRAAGEFGCRCRRRCRRNYRVRGDGGALAAACWQSVLPGVRRILQRV
jgi:hypothetical protein